MLNYPDPIEPQLTVADFLHLQTMEIDGKAVTWAAGGTDTAAGQRQLRWQLPKVGLLSRIWIDVDGLTATGYDFTAGGGTGAVAADGMGPFGLVENIELRVNGSVALFNVSGFGAYLLEAAEAPEALPGVSSVGTIYTTAPTDIESTIFSYDPTQDHRPRWGISVPLSLAPGQPLGMVLAGNDQTSLELVLTLASLSKFAALAGGGTAGLGLTFTPTLELFAVPEPVAFAQFVRPLLDWAHVCRETQQDIVATGDQRVTLDNHDNILQVLHTVKLNGALNVDSLTAGQFVLNMTDKRYEHGVATQLRRQRRAFQKDIPAWVWSFFTTGTLRDAIRADSYTDIRSILTVASGATLGTAPFIRTAERRLVQLDARAG
ncbi:MAG: hypothetical protein IT352_15445 [Gemmatimonadales bacterium]|nr:hypothetical protein [Gemmatimonadales bacterium]